MNMVAGETIEFFDMYAHLVDPFEIKNKIIICPPFTAIDTAVWWSEKLGFLVGAQNLHHEPRGAFTGEISGSMLSSVGVRYVLVGHSERRTLFLETDEVVSKKMVSAISAGLVPVLCIGETKKQREEGMVEKVLMSQLEIALENVDTSCEFLVAYEPVWAIGTGLSATTEEITKTHAFLRQALEKIIKGKQIPILYGGSANETNAQEILSIDNVDGLLVGGAALNPGKFAKIIGNYT